jgi:hypothetical protein
MNDQAPLLYRPATGAKLLSLSRANVRDARRWRDQGRIDRSLTTDSTFGDRTYRFGGSRRVGVLLVEVLAPFPPSQD